MKKTALATMLSAAVICAGMSASAFAQDANAQAESTTEQSTQVVDTHMQAAIDVVEQTGTIPPFEGHFEANCAQFQTLADPRKSVC